MSEYDYIIVGAGSAGCTLAGRLAEDGTRTVLLLEAGGSDRRPWVQLPIGYGKSFYDPRVNWMYSTEPDPELNDRPGYWPRGKVLGGSGSINAMIHIRGLAGDFDDWREAGNPGWGWADLLPWFRRMESYDGGDEAVRGRDGPLHISNVMTECHLLCDTFLGACGQLGVRRSADLNGADPEGVGYYQITTRNGRRMSAARAYLRPLMGRRNLRVELRALARRVLFNGGRAVGVEYLRHGEPSVALARREVIVAAGAINSPQLLQLSGVGPAWLLAKYGIPIVHDLPAVGENLQDHLCIDHLYRSRQPTLNVDLGTWGGRVRAALRYAAFRRGPLAMSVNQAGGFVRTRKELERPDIQLYFSPLSYTRAPPGKRALMRPDPFPGFLLSAQPCRPASRGHIRIRSADPAVPPELVANSLSASGDLQTLLAGTRFLRQLAATPAFAAVIDEELKPGQAVTSESDLVADLRQRASSVFHPVGTCRMGRDPRGSVVDARLRVHGLAGLRVIDASIFPNLTSGNTNTPTIMVAEKGADLLRQDAARAAGGTLSNALTG